MFMEYDTNHDGVMDIEEFQVLMKKMHEREKSMDKYNLFEKMNSDLQEDKDQSHGDILKQRTVKLFNKALDVSIHHYLKSKQDFRHNRQMQIFEQSWDKDEE